MVDEEGIKKRWNNIFFKIWNWEQIKFSKKKKEWIKSISNKDDKDVKE